jgi:acyl-CoA thioesterase-2
VGDLDKDTAVTEVGEGRYLGRLSEDWAIWGPNGGYVASLALRAAGLACGRARPASLVAHYLSVAQFDDVEVTATTLRRSRLATSLRVSLSQGDQPVLDALVWGVDQPGENDGALVHDESTMPEVPPVDEVLSFDQRVERGTTEPSEFAFWDNAEFRPIEWFEPYPPEGPQPATARWWWRFRPTARFDDPWVEACRQLIPLDTMGWPAAHAPHVHRDPLDLIAPTIDLSVRFHQPQAPDDEWQLCEMSSPIATGGLMNASGRVWSSDGTLLASGGQSMLCRRAPRPPS